jgi:hypothetical protein
VEVRLGEESRRFGACTGSLGWFLRRPRLRLLIGRHR